MLPRGRGRIDRVVPHESWGVIDVTRLATLNFCLVRRDLVISMAHASLVAFRRTLLLVGVSHLLLLVGETVGDYVDDQL